MKSDRSMDKPPEFKDGCPSEEERYLIRACSHLAFFFFFCQRSFYIKSPAGESRLPGPSCVSMKSDRSMDKPPEFKDGCPSEEERRVQQERADSPGPSCVSMKSDRSMDKPPEFKDGCPSEEERRVQQERADSPGPSCVSMKSDRSMDKPPEFKDGCPSKEERQHQERSKVTSAQSEMIKRAEEDAHAFLDKELKKLWRGLSQITPQCSECQREEEDTKKEEQRRRAIEGVVDITKLCLMEMNQEELADKLWGGRDSYFENREYNLILKQSSKRLFF
ncbi:hypothetical protein N1851_035253 [Merluccius polli]|uniref:Uncharacterized protein n=1 Tax=Merluccius polli TaxID=89951 RepID=A0AA47NLY1_MERPO|nr:hypothetical protein N1851_035253 [Merluccius polli]